MDMPLKYKIFYCETSNDGTVGGSHSCMYNLIRYSDRSKFEFTVGVFFENQYVQKYNDLKIDVVIIPIVPSRRNGWFMTRKLINWYNREYRLENFLLSYIDNHKFDILMMNNTIYESKNFLRVGRRLELPVAVYERGIMQYRPEHIVASEHVDASIAVSKAIMKNMSDYKFRSKIIELIYDGIDPDLYKGPFERSKIKKDLNIPVDSKVIGIVGNVRTWKGQEYFIKAIVALTQRYPDLHGLIIGGWSDVDLDYLKSLRQMVDDADLSHRIFFLGYRKDTPALLSILDVFVHASIQPEPFGMVLLEAMAAKVPVVATRLGGPMEILNGGKCGTLVQPENAYEIAEGCIRYFSDDIYRRDIVEKAYIRLCEKFHITNTVKNVGNLLEKLVKE